MTDLSQTAQELRRVANFFSGIVAAADAMDDMARLQAEAESVQAKTLALKGEAEKYESRVAEAKDALAKLQADAAAAVDAHKSALEAERDKMVLDIRRAADELMAATEANAAVVTRDAKAARDSIAAQAAEVQGVLDELNAEAAAATVRRDAVLQEVADAEQDLAKVKLKLSTMLNA